MYKEYTSNENAFIQQKWRCRTIIETNTVNTDTFIVTSLRLYISQNELLDCQNFLSMLCLL